MGVSLLHFYLIIFFSSLILGKVVNFLVDFLFILFLLFGNYTTICMICSKSESDPKNLGQHFKL